MERAASGLEVEWLGVAAGEVGCVFCVCVLSVVDKRAEVMLGIRSRMCGSF